MSKILAFAAVCTLALLAVGRACAAEAVVVRSSEPKQPSSSVVIYRATCADAVYSLEFDFKNKNVRFRPGEAADTIDLTDSALGKVFLSNKLYGNVGLTCYNPGLNVFFAGYRLTAAGVKPASYTVYLDKSGTLSHDGGLQDESEDFVLRHPMH
jgi:hypothetical protein